MKKIAPHVVIVGRTNVGKSTLFNRLSLNTKAIVFNQEGVTRDFISEEITWDNATFSLIDTGGLSILRQSDEINKQVQNVARNCVYTADLLLFVVDGSVPLHPVDQQIAKELRKTGKKIVLVINKIDKNSSQDFTQEITHYFNFPDVVLISAEHGKGIANLLTIILSFLPKEIKENKKEILCKVVLLGKPNVGKSSLLNALLHKERSIVSEVPGTTREAIIEKVNFLQEEIQIADTAGVRRKRSITENLEKSMVSSTMYVVKDTDVVLLLIDAHEGKLSDQEIKLAYYVFEEQKKGLIMLYNKQDLVDEELKAQLDYDKEEYEQLLSKLISIPISCVSGKNIGKILPAVKDVWQRYSQFLDNELLFSTLMMAMEHKTLHKNQNRLILYKLKQINTSPITILLTVNEPKWFDDSHSRFFENILRKKFNLQSVPVVFGYRKKYE